MNTERVAEWNMWYHVLNCGFRVAASGETDFPCMSGERVGIGRVYAQVDGKLTFDKWVNSIADGRSYVSDGQCHLLGFRATDSSTGVETKLGVDGRQGELDSPSKVTFSVDAAALLDGSDVSAELIINGYPVAAKQVAGVEQCWKSKQNTYALDEQSDATAASDHAHSVYKRLISAGAH